MLVTRSADGAVAVALWNYHAPYGEGPSYTPPPPNPGPNKRFVVRFAGVPADAAVTVERLDQDHGNVVKAFDAMGRPATPSRQQIQQLRAAGQAAPAERAVLKGGVLELTIPPQGLVLIKVMANGSR